MRDFNRSILSALARKGISIVGLTVIPSSGGIFTFSQVLEAAR